LHVNDFKGKEVTASDILYWIKQETSLERKKNKAVKLKYFGMHSVWYGAALSMYLLGASVVDIML